jgi:hypothetical protein
MSDAIISFQRRFEVWLYIVSHGQLLLRSNRSEKFSTRIDVLFKDVAAMALPTAFDELSIAEVSTDVARDLNVQLGVWRLERRKVFAIRGANFRGYVVAGAVFWHEDEGTHSDPSYFESLRIPRSP